MPTFALNFSRPGSEVVAQYFMFAALGFEGYRKVLGGAQQVATYLASSIAEIGPYRLLTEGTDLPVFAFALAPEVTNYTVFDVSDRLRAKGWQVPAYTMPDNATDVAVLRIVVREGFSFDLADDLLADLADSDAYLQAHPAGLGPDAAGFSHT